MEPYAPTATWTLASGDGVKTVHARVRDQSGNVSDPKTDTIGLDTVLPAISSLVVNGGASSTTSTTVALNLTASDDRSGLADVRFSNDGSSWSSWQPYAASQAWSLGAGDGPKQVYAQVRDAAGNVSATASDEIALSSAAGAEFGLSIDQGALFTNAVSVSLTVAGRPNTAEMQISNDGGFAGAMWEPYAVHKEWTITRVGSHVIPRVVYARFRDVNGTISAAVSDDIVLDETAPTGSLAIGANASTTIQSPTRQLALSASDDLSGVDRMRLSNRADFAGATWQPYATAAVWDFAGGGTVYGQFRDRAGNLSSVYSQSLPGATPPGASPNTSCSPRPRIVVTPHPSNGTLVVTLATTGANNGLRAVRFDSFANAVVDVGEQRGQTAPFAVSIPAGQEPTGLQFTVRRQTPGAATVQLVVVDGCGEWSTFVGGGPNAF